MKYVLLITFLFLTACEAMKDSRGYVEIECFDKSGKLVRKNRGHEFTVEATDKGKTVEVHSCTIMGEQ